MAKRRPVRRPPPVARASPADARAFSRQAARRPGEPLVRRLVQRLRAAPPSAVGLLLVRVFFGVTFVYAGLDKLLDPNFFDPASGGSIQSQFAAFERVSPLAPLVRLMEPLAIPLGALIALGEIGAGLGALTGLVFRLAALGGAALALLFYLTASWATQPYYLGPDLPYAVGWLALAIGGHGGLFVLHLPAQPAAETTPSAAPVPIARWLSRRQLLEFGALAGVTLVVGSAAASLRYIVLGRPVATSTPSPVPTTVPTPGATGTPNALAVAQVADVQSRGAVRIRVPVTAPAPLPAGDPAFVVKLDDGSFAAYDAICTHAGCTVRYEADNGILYCPCHGAAFDPGNHGKVLTGPTRIPLTELPLVIDAASGTISLRA